MPSTISSKKDAPFSRMNSATFAALALTDARLVSERWCPDRSRLARKQADGRRFQRGNAPAVRFRLCRRPKPGPGDAPREAGIVEQPGVVTRKPRGQDGVLPCNGRRLEAGKLLDHGIKRLRAFAPRIGRNALPVEQEAEIVARGDGLDLGAESLHRIAVDARE